MHTSMHIKYIHAMQMPDYDVLHICYDNVVAINGVIDYDVITFIALLSYQPLMIRQYRSYFRYTRAIML